MPFENIGINYIHSFKWDHNKNGHLFERPLTEKEFYGQFDTIFIRGGSIFQIKKSGWFEYKCDYCNKDTCIFEKGYSNQIRESDNTIFTKNNL